MSLRLGHPLVRMFVDKYKLSMGGQQDCRPHFPRLLHLHIRRHFFACWFEPGSVGGGLHSLYSLALVVLQVPSRYVLHVVVIPRLRAP